MKQILIYLLAISYPAAVWAGTNGTSSDLSELKEQLRQANEAFERAMQQHQAAVTAIQQRIQALEGSGGASHPPAVAEAALSPATAPVPPPSQPKPWSPADPIRVGGAQAYMDLGLVGTFAAGGSTASDIEGGTELGGHDPNQRGFTVQGVEATFTGAVDPYFRGLATLNFSVDAEGESFFEMEEGWMETVSLPANLKLRGGQIYSEFGRHNPAHLHTWDFVDTPLVNGRFLGPDGLRNPGAHLAWLVPAPFYTELIFGVQNSQGATAASFRGGGGHTHGGEDDELPLAYRHADNDRGVATFSDLLLTPRLVSSFELSDEITLLLGASAAFGPNDIGAEGGGDTRTEIYGADLTFKWKPVDHHGGFPFVKWQTEGLWRRTGVGAFDWSAEGTKNDPGVLLDPATGDDPAVLDRETLSDYGFYTQLVYGFRKGWTTGLRFDWLDRQTGEYEERGLLVADGSGSGTPAGNDLLRNARWRISPNLTWYPTEFSKVRLQYNYDDRRDVGIDHSVWLQFEFILGAHAAHKF
jgi:hypothetical protein